MGVLLTLSFFSYGQRESFILPPPRLDLKYALTKNTETFAWVGVYGLFTGIESRHRNQWSGSIFEQWSGGDPMHYWGDPNVNWERKRDWWNLRGPFSVVRDGRHLEETLGEYSKSLAIISLKYKPQTFLGKLGMIVGLEMTRWAFWEVGNKITQKKFWGL